MVTLTFSYQTFPINWRRWGACRELYSRQFRWYTCSMIQVFKSFLRQLHRRISLFDSKLDTASRQVNIGNGCWPQRPPNPHEWAPGKQQSNNLSKEHVLWMIERRSILQRSLYEKSSSTIFLSKLSLSFSFLPVQRLYHWTEMLC